MLELPEVEVLRKDLEKEAVGKRVKDVIVQTPSIVRPYHRTRPELAQALEGHKIEAARRRGRIVFLDLDGNQTWVIDAGPSGSLHRETANEEPGEDTHLVVTFTIGGAVHLSDAAGEPQASTGVVPTDDAMTAVGLSARALDPLEDNLPWMEFGSLLHQAAQPLKSLLTDEGIVLGIGPVYSDEILWEAGLRHDRLSDTLSTQEVRRLYRAMQEVLYAAIKERGTSLDDAEADVAIDDEGEPAEHLRVYGRVGLPCIRCRQPIVRTRLRKGVYTYHCERCMM